MNAATAPQPAVMIASPTTTRTLDDDVPLRAQVDAVRLFNLRAFLASRGWQSRTDLASTDGIDQLVLIGRAGCSADELAHRARAKLATFEGFGPATLNWADIDDLAPDGANAHEVLAELSDTWPPQDWHDLVLRDVTGPIPLAKAVGGAAVAASGATFDLTDEPEGPLGLLTRPVTIPRADVEINRVPLLVTATDTRPRTASDGAVASADGIVSAALDGGELTLTEARRTRPARFPAWVEQRGLASPVRLLAVSRSHGHVLEVIVSTAGQTAVVATGDQRTWMPAEFLDRPAVAAAQVGRSRIVVDLDGRVTDLASAAHEPLDSAVTAIGVDAAVVGFSSMLVLWGTAGGRPTAEVHRLSSRNRRWQLLAAIDDVVRAGIQRTGRTRAVRTGAWLWVTRADGEVEPIDLSALIDGSRA